MFKARDHEQGGKENRDIYGKEKITKTKNRKWIGRRKEEKATQWEQKVIGGWISWNKNMILKMNAQNEDLKNEWSKSDEYNHEDFEWEKKEWRRNER